MSKAANPFNPRLIAAVAAAGIAAFAAFLVLLAYAGDFRSGRDGRAHALSVAATGFKGIVSLVGYSGRTAALLRDEGALQREDLVVAALEEQTSPDALKAFLERRGARATLLILPKWSTLSDPLHPGWVGRFGPLQPAWLKDKLAVLGEVTLSQADVAGRPVATGALLLEGIGVPAPARVQTISGAKVQPLLAVPGMAPMLARVGGGNLFVLADPDLMNNQGMRDPRVAQAALSILDSLNATGAETISFDLTLNGFARARSGLKLMFEPPFLALTFALFVAALLAGFHGISRFGEEKSEERAIAFGKAALVENSAGLMRLARREHRAGGAYAELIRERAAHEAAAPQGEGEAAVEAYLDRLAGPGGRPFTSLADAAAHAPDAEALVEAARALFFWRKELAK